MKCEEYTIVIDLGKPYEVIAKNDNELKQVFRELRDLPESSSYYDIQVYDYKGLDITESQFINEIVGDD